MTRRRGWLLVVAVLAVVAIGACGSSGPKPPKNPALATFCKVSRQVNGTHPQSYFGSAQNLADVTKLEAVAPASVKTDLEIYRGFIAGGGIDPQKAGSDDISGFPPVVRSAVTASSNFITANC